MQKYLFYQQNPAILIFLTKCNFKNSMLWKWKFPIFEKQLILSIAFPFIDDFTLNIDKINCFLNFWPLIWFFRSLLWMKLRLGRLEYEYLKGKQSTRNARQLKSLNFIDQTTKTNKHTNKQANLLSKWLTWQICYALTHNLLSQNFIFHFISDILFWISSQWRKRTSKDFLLLFEDIHP